MFRKSSLPLLALVVIVLAASCSPHEVGPAAAPNMANPASVYCQQNGGRLDLRQDSTGGVNGFCVFPDGRTCDEWAYFHGECGPVPQEVSTAVVTDVATASITGGDSGGNVGAGGYMPPGTAEEIADWWGVIKSTEPGAQYDDYFKRQDLGQVIYFGIDSTDPAVQSQIEALRDSGRIVHLYGTLLSNVPDYNGSQIQVDRIDVGH